jgi:hypothetical protein
VTKKKKEKFDQEEIFCSRKRRPRERRQNLVPITFVSFLDPLFPPLFVCLFVGVLCLGGVEGRLFVGV